MHNLMHVHLRAAVAAGLEIWGQNAAAAAADVIIIFEDGAEVAGAVVEKRAHASMMAVASGGSISIPRDRISHFFTSMPEARSISILQVMAAIISSLQKC
jgi:hypothetical protein